MSDLIFGKVVGTGTNPNLMCGKPPKNVVLVNWEGFVSGAPVENYIGKLEIERIGEKITAVIDSTICIPKIGDIAVSQRGKELRLWIIMDKLAKKYLDSGRLIIEFNEQNCLRITLIV